MTLADSERRALGAIAWRAIVAAARGERIRAHGLWSQPPPAGGPDPALPESLADRRGGAFVSLHRRGTLRGCIGRLDVDGPIVAVIAEMAAAAATADPRFPALTSPELDDLEVEISLLGPLVPIEGPADIVLGRDGVLVRSAGRTGVLLPQVAHSWGFDREEFVAQTCRKAGLRPDAWAHGARLYRFEAEVFDAERPAASGPG